MQEAVDLKKFIDNSKDKFQALEKFKLESDKIRFNGLLTGFISLASTIDRYEKELASEYNIFRILKNIHAKEVITHSPFMADLLNTNGRHKQGDLFYNEFLKQLNLGEKEFQFIPDDRNLFFVEKEKHIGFIDDTGEKGGQIDILITYRDKQKQFAIAIENKINAVDQKNQLLRYYNYLKLVHQPNFLLVYLTKNEKEINITFPSDYDQDEVIKAKQRIININYKQHVSQLIQQSLNFINANNIRAILIQYLQIINDL